MDPEPLFRRTGLDVEATRDPDARYPQRATALLWRLAVEKTRDPCFGIEVAMHCSPTMFHALGFAVLASGTLREALERVVRFVPFVSSAASASLHERGSQYRFVISSSAQYSLADESVDALVALLVRVARVLASRSFSPVRIELRRPRPEPHAAFQRYFRCPIEFDAPENVIVIDRRGADAPLHGAVPEVARLNEQVAARALVRMHAARLSDRVRALLVERLPSGELSKGDVARGLKMSARSLQRRLTAEGTTYAQILDGTRRGLAITYVGQSLCSIGEIGHLLGFSRAPSFVRAFRRWTGVAPTAYRAARAPAVADLSHTARQRPRAHRGAGA